MQQKDFIYNKFCEFSTINVVELIADSSKKEELKAVKKLVKAALLTELSNPESTVKYGGVPDRAKVTNYCSSVIANWLKRDKRYYS
jgi:hypothetical protein